jgi:excisionase family DNA binding protein
MRGEKMGRDKDLLKPGEVAELFRVDSKTVTRWAQTGKIGSLKTPGGHRRLLRNEVEAWMDANFTPSVAAERKRQLAAMVQGRPDGS